MRSALDDLKYTDKLDVYPVAWILQPGNLGALIIHLQMQADRQKVAKAKIVAEAQRLDLP